MQIAVVQCRDGTREVTFFEGAASITKKLSRIGAIRLAVDLIQLPVIDGYAGRRKPIYYRPNSSKTASKPSKTHSGASKT